jgi:Mn-containing catalase
VTKLLNIHDISNTEIPEPNAFHERGVHRTLYRFSPEDYRDIDRIWNGAHPEDGEELVVEDGPPEGSRRPAGAGAANLLTWLPPR